MSYSCYLFLFKLLTALRAFDLVIEKQATWHIGPAMWTFHHIRAHGEIVSHEII
uniref:hypothetical protein n=1 Tax=Candidatus Wujingus californicus TaxID=3367618 RepID=UPI004027B345